LQRNGGKIYSSGSHSLLALLFIFRIIHWELVATDWTSAVHLEPGLDAVLVKDVGARKFHQAAPELELLKADRTFDVLLQYRVVSHHLGQILQPFLRDRWRTTWFVQLQQSIKHCMEVIVITGILCWDAAQNQEKYTSSRSRRRIARRRIGLSLCHIGNNV
jgi:hypothetical protein